jgi:hypothetical protein
MATTRHNRNWMRLSKSLRADWNEWARANEILVRVGRVNEPRHVSGRVAFETVERNRALAGDVQTLGKLPVVGTFLDGKLSNIDCGPYTNGIGYIGFRTVEALGAPTKWFVWATAPVEHADSRCFQTLAFIKVLTLGALEAESLIAPINDDYEAVHGEWRPPGYGQGAIWDPLRVIRFRLHHYLDGVLSPGRALWGTIQPELG